MYEIDYRAKPDYVIQDKVREQYAYAQKNIDSMASISQMIEKEESMSTGDDQGIRDYFLSKVPTLIFRVASFFCLVYLFTWLMNGAANRMNEKYKFEVKTAKDITQRMDDVKGIDEIKEEVQNLIKMIRDPKKY